MRSEAGCVKNAFVHACLEPSIASSCLNAEHLFRSWFCTALAVHPACPPTHPVLLVSAIYLANRKATSPHHSCPHSMVPSNVRRYPSIDAPHGHLDWSCSRARRAPRADHANATAGERRGVRAGHFVVDACAVGLSGIAHWICSARLRQRWRRGAVPCPLSLLTARLAR